MIMELNKSDIESIASNRWQEKNKIIAVIWFITTVIIFIVAVTLPTPFVWVLIGIGFASGFARFYWQIRGIKKATRKLLEEQKIRN